MSKFLANQSVAALNYEVGTRETNTITMPAVAAATQGDYVMMYNAAGTSTAAFIDIDANGTAPIGALYVASDSQATLAYVNAVSETYVLTFADTAGTTQADYVMLYNLAGVSTAVNLDIDANTTLPTGALYVGSDNQIEVDIVGGGTAANNATLAYTALNGNITGVGFTDNLDGTLTVLLGAPGPSVGTAVSKDDDDAGAGSTTVGTITKGVLATTAIVGGGLLATVTLADTTLTDNGDATVTFAAVDVGDATDCVPKDNDDAGAGTIGVSATDGGAESFPYESPGDSPTARLITPSTVT